MIPKSIGGKSEILAGKSAIYSRFIPPIYFT